MSVQTVNTDANVDDLLSSCRRQIFFHTLGRGIATLMIVVLAAVLLATGLDLIVGLPSIVRLVLLIGSVAATCIAFWRFLIAPLMVSIPADQLGAAVDLSCPELNESLGTLLSLQNPETTKAEAGSRLMRKRIEDQVRSRVQQLSTDEVVDSKTTRKRSGAAASLLVVALIPLFAWPSVSQLLLHRMVAPYANLATPSNLYFFIADGDRTVAEGTTVIIAAEPRWRSASDSERPEKVVLEMTAETGTSDTMPMLFDETSNSFIAEIPRIQNSIQYRVSGGGTQSEMFTLTVLEAPKITTATLTATPPAYTGRAVEAFDGMLGRMDVFEKSDLEIVLQFNKPVESAALVWTRRDERPPSEEEKFNLEFDHLTGEEIVAETRVDDWDPSRTDEERQAMEGIQNDDPEDEDPDAPLAAEPELLNERIAAILSEDRTVALIDMQADVGGDFVFEIFDEHELTNADEPGRNLTVIYDHPPALQITGISQGDSIRPDDILPVNCLAQDDVGIGELELHYRINDDVSRIIAATDFERGAATVQYNFRIQLEDFDVSSGDRLTLRVRAVDERPDPNPQETWSDPMTLRIDDEAKALGAEAAARESRALVEALKKLSDELQKDEGKARELASGAKKQWDDAKRDETRRLSEKEQQQGRFLERVAEQVATHPLMKEAAEQLKAFSDELRSDIPNNLDDAVNADRREASERLSEAAKDLEKLRENLNDQIRAVEKQAELEEDLAELNRLALEAEQLAADADQLQEDATLPENRPEELDEREWQEELDQRRQQLGTDQEELVEDLGDLLQREQELLDAAQRAQREAAERIAERASELADQERRVAEGVREEAQDVQRDAQNIARDLDRARREAERLNQQLQQNAPQVDRPQLDMAKEAADQLRQGEFAEPQQAVEDLRDAFQEAQQQLQEANDAPADAARRDELADEAEQLAQQMEQINEAIDNLQNDAAPDQDAAEPIAEMLERLKEMADAADQVANDLQQNPDTNPGAQKNAVQAANQADEAVQEAAAGQFDDAAQELRKAAQAAQQSAAQSNQPGQQDQREQLQDLGDQFQRSAEMLQNMQQDNSAQATAQQLTQEQIAAETAQLSEQLSEVAERMEMEQLQMQEAGQQAQQAQQAAGQAQQSSQQANSQLENGQMQQAGESAQQAASQLQQAAQQAQQAAGQPGDGQQSDQSRVPSEVGESVAEALQNLSQAAQAMQQGVEPGEQPSDQSSEQAAGQQAGQPGQPGQGEPGQGQGQQGQPGEGQTQQGQPGQGQGQPGQGQNPSNEQLSSAAQALADAARNALPEQFSPGQQPEGEGSGEGSGGGGNAAGWDGLSPNRVGAADADGIRNWGQSHEELDTEVSTQLGGSRDKQYESLIRLYFREVAKATADEK